MQPLVLVVPAPNDRRQNGKVGHVDLMGLNSEPHERAAKKHTVILDHRHSLRSVFVSSRSIVLASHLQMGERVEGNERGGGDDGDDGDFSILHDDAVIRMMTMVILIMMATSNSDDDDE